MTRAVRVLVLALAAWSCVAVGIALLWRADGPDPDPRLYPAQWALGGEQVEPLRELLERVDRMLPRGATVAVDSRVYPHDELIYLQAWVSYLLPRHRVLRVVPQPSSRPAYVLVVPPPKLELPTPPGQTVLLHEPAARLLRLEPSPGAAEAER